MVSKDDIKTIIDATRRWDNGIAKEYYVKDSMLIECITLELQNKERITAIKAQKSPK